MKTSKFTDSQIMSILKQAESGTPVATLCREHGMSNGLCCTKIYNLKHSPTHSNLSYNSGMRST